MPAIRVSSFIQIHRHTGGLESHVWLGAQKRRIHRHTGGLENHASPAVAFGKIHRHTGGLENQ